MSSITHKKVIDELKEECWQSQDNIQYQEFLIKTIYQLQSIFDTIPLTRRYKTTTEMSFEEYCKEKHRREVRTKRAYHSQEYSCECGAVIQLGSKSSHRKSKRHLDNLDKNKKN